MTKNGFPEKIKSNSFLKMNKNKNTLFIFLNLKLNILKGLSSLYFSILDP